MSKQELTEAVMGLPEKDRLDLAREIIASVRSEREAMTKVEQAVEGIEDVLTGKVRGLNEEEFRDALR